MEKFPEDVLALGKQVYDLIKMVKNLSFNFCKESSSLNSFFSLILSTQRSERRLNELDMEKTRMNFNVDFENDEPYRPFDMSFPLTLIFFSTSSDLLFLS